MEGSVERWRIKSVEHRQSISQRIVVKKKWTNGETQTSRARGACRGELCLAGAEGAFGFTVNVPPLFVNV
jgi:hypothetical protein